jgi:hypothetical protein
VATDNTAGWLKFAVAGADEGNLQCDFIAKGTFDDSVTHNREAIPEVLPLEAIESRVMNDQRFPDLTHTRGLFTADGYHPETSIGYLLVVPGSGFGFDFGDFLDTTGATTVDIQRQWDEGAVDHSFSLLVDASDGRVIGWTSLQAEVV